MQEFMPNVDNRLIKAIIDPEEENTIIMKDFFYDGYNVKIRFTTNDILNPLIEMDEQTFASTAEAFGTNYGDGYLHLYQSSSGVVLLQYLRTVHLPVLHTVCTGHGWQQCSRNFCQRH